MIESKESDNFFNYSFSKNELLLLAKFLRGFQENLPEGLEPFYRALEDSIYDTMSLEEVKRFYS